MSTAKLFVCIIEKEDKLEEILEAFVEEGITGASILETRGMFEYLADEIPLFAGFRNLINQSGPQNKMIISIRQDDEEVRRIMDVVEDVCGQFSNSNTGIMFSLDISAVRGFKS